jgi:PAS domain S-box-containing protein
VSETSNRLSMKSSKISRKSLTTNHILIVDDHEVVRRGLRSLLSSRPEWTICGEAVDGLDAVEKAKILRPAVVLMDISMPRMNGLEAARIIGRDLPDSKVVIISQNDPAIARHQAEEVNAAGYVAKSDLPRLLLPTVSKLLSEVAGKNGNGSQSASTPDWLAGGGVLGQLIRTHDWSNTPLGAIDCWPQSLKTSVNLILNSQHPMWLGWGPEATFLYNEAYIPVLSLAKHPSALGKPAAEVWSEIWDICGPLADKVFEKGEASFVDEVRLLMNRGDFLEETYYSFSYSPIRDESGNVAGLFCPSTEVTPKIINARRLRTLSELSVNALVQKTTDAACESVAATLARSKDDIPFAVLYLIDDASSEARLEQACGLNRGIDDLAPESIPLGKDLAKESASACPWPLAEVVRTGRSEVVSIQKIEGLPLGVGQQRLSEAMVLPVTSRGESGTVGVLIAGVSPARKLDIEYRTFYELIAGQIATAIQNVRAAEEERERLEALAEIDRAKTTFFSNVSHEFRTPLTLMLGPVEDLLAKSHTGLSPAAKSQLELVNRNGSRLLRLVNTLLDFSRIEAGRMQAIYQRTDLAAFTVELASVFRSATEKAGLRLELDCPRLAEAVFVDRGMWEKIVLNLISNAFKFTFEGEIAIRVAHAGDHVELRVRDTGVGIPVQELPRLFDRFHRIENTRSRTHEGSGIGLALVQELVKLHGGSVRVESVVGKGSTFIVSLPLGSAHLPADRIGGTRTLATTALGAAPFVEEALRWLPDSGDGEPLEEIAPGNELIPVPCPPLQQSDSTSDKRPVILVADDNADMRQYLVRLLGERYQVQAVPDGQVALAAVRERSPDLVLSDVMMPNLDGFALLHELRSDPKTRTIPIILLSARAGEESRVEGMEHGADDYLIKPFSARELLARVQTHLEMARVRRQAEEALRRRTEQFETLLNEAPLGVYLVDGDFRIRAMNPPSVQAFAAVENPMGRDFGEAMHILWPQASADEIVKRFRHTLETGEPYLNTEYSEHRMDRAVLEVYEWQINRIALPEGGYGVVCYFRDISRQVRAREGIVESEKKLRLATDAAELGIWHWYPDEDHASWDNDRCYEVYGRTREDGPLSKAEFLEEVIHPEDKEAFNQAMAATLETGVRLFFQGRIYRKDKTEGWVELTGQVEHCADGSPLRVLGTILDITERKKIEERERMMTAEAVAATAKFRAVFEQTTVFAGIMSLDGAMIDANELCLEACGYRAEDALGRPFWETPWWRKSKDVQAKIMAATTQAAQGEPFREILTYHWADDTERIVDFAIHPIRNHDGEILFLHPTGVDITDLKRAEENYKSLAESLDAEVRVRTDEVVRQSELLRDLSSRLLQAQDEERRRIARELHDSAGQILVALSMNLSQAAQNAPPEARLFSKLTEESEHLVQQLSQEIRTMSYLLHPPLLDETGISEALRWYIQGLRERSGLEIALEIPADFERLPREMELVMFRLVQECLTNIHRHSGSQTATIRVARDNENVSLDIQDSGKGISAEKLSGIQARSSGVGIRGMRERVRHFGGRMDIESDKDGTKISFTLPLPKKETPKQDDVVLPGTTDQSIQISG